MIHLHVRDAQLQHSLEPAHYRPAIDAVRAAVGDRMLIQVTSEAAGIYKPDEQIRLIEALMPGGVSIAVREFFVDEVATENAARLLARLKQAGTLIQYILYETADVLKYRQLVAGGAIPGKHWVLFVLGRYADPDDAGEPLSGFISALENEAPWMACAFGARAFERLSEAATLGGHVRIGFENGWWLPDGSVAQDNAALVASLAGRLENAGMQIAQARDAKTAIAN